MLDREKLKEYLYSRIESQDEPYYVFLDEVQEVTDFERIVNGLNKRANVNVYVTGSNSKFLSSVRHIKISDDTVAKYIGYLEDAFLFTEAKSSTSSRPSRWVLMRRGIRS